MFAVDSRVYVWSTNSRAVWFHRGEPVLLPSGPTVYRPACSSELLKEAVFSTRRGDVPQLMPCTECLADEVADARDHDIRQWVRLIASIRSVNPELWEWLRAQVKDVGWPPAVVWWVYTIWRLDPEYYNRGALYHPRNASYVYAMLKGQAHRQRHAYAVPRPSDEPK